VKLLTVALQLHPGGEQIILKYAGRDATAAYKPIHPEDALEKSLPKEQHLGFVDANAIREIQQSDTDRKQTKDELRMERARANKLPLGRILTLQDMEVRFGNCRFTTG
jgi:L-lactate dehydrogenase (cytochrome)